MDGDCYIQYISCNKLLSLSLFNHICVSILGSPEASVHVWSAIISSMEVEIRKGFMLFGLDFGPDMVWEQLTGSFPVGAGMYAMLSWWDREYRSCVVQNASTVS